MSERYLGPKGGTEIATPVRAWIRSRCRTNKRRRCGTNDVEVAPECVGPSGLTDLLIPFLPRPHGRRYLIPALRAFKQTISVHLRTQQAGPELISQQSILESLDPINTQHRYFVSVAREQRRVAFDIDFFERIKVSAVGLGHRFFHFLAQVTARL
jgi:hypothetical protein